MVSFDIIHNLETLVLSAQTQGSWKRCAFNMENFTLVSQSVWSDSPCEAFYTAGNGD